MPLHQIENMGLEMQSVLEKWAQTLLKTQRSKGRQLKLNELFRF